MKQKILNSFCQKQIRSVEIVSKILEWKIICSEKEWLVSEQTM